jgi:ABC-type Mn2+/Zn2+ transport system ATPase subunit
LLLLQILKVHNNCSSLPTSRHALLQAVLDEPLVPLDTNERRELYRQQQQQAAACMDWMDLVDHDCSTSLLADMNMQQLIHEEQD